MRTNVLNKVRPLRPDLIPPANSHPVGVHTDGRMIYEREERDHQATSKNRVPVIGPDGQPLYRKDAQGNAYPVMRVEPVMVKRRFVLERSPSGKVKKQYHFELTEAERVANDQKKIQNEFSEILAAEAVERNLTPREMIARLLDPIRAAGDGAVIVEREYPVHRGGAHWILSDGTNFKGSKTAAQAAEAEVSGVRVGTEPDDDTDEF